MRSKNLILIYIFVFSLLINNNLFCLNKNNQKVKESIKRNFFIGVLLGNYKIKDERFERIYNKKRTIIGLEFIYELYKNQKYRIETGFGLKFYSTNGYSTVTNDYTEFKLRPYILNFRVNYYISEFFEPFAGFGFDYYSYKEDCPALISTEGGKFGYHVEIGGCVGFPKLKWLGLRGYLRYSVINTEENNIKVELGGLEFGVGMFYRFSL